MLRNDSQMSRHFVSLLGSHHKGDPHYRSYVCSITRRMLPFTSIPALDLWGRIARKHLTDLHCSRKFAQERHRLARGHGVFNDAYGSVTCTDSGRDSYTSHGFTCEMNLSVYLFIKAKRRAKVEANPGTARVKRLFN